MEKSIQLKAYAKINWALKITEKREDGYHNLISIMQNIGLYDQISINLSDSFNIECNKINLTGEKNICYKAFNCFMEKTGINQNITLKIMKKIPIQAGLGGGSADAAGVLLGLNRMFDYPLNEKELYEIGESLGSDVPFFFMGGIVKVSSKGENLQKINCKNAYDILLIKPYRGISTRKAFSQYVLSDDHTKVDFLELEEGLIKRNYVKIAKNMGNSLEKVCINQCRDIKTAIEMLKEGGAEAAVMSGSGSSVFGLFKNGNDAYKAKKIIQKKFFCISTKTKTKAIEFH